MEELVRLQKVIAERGFCSRRKAEELILDNKVKVNGEIVAYNFYVLHENVFLQHSFFKKDSAIVYHLFFLLCICVNSIPVYLLFNSVQFSHSVMSDSS